MPHETLIGYLLAGCVEAPDRAFVARPCGAVTTYADGAARVASIGRWLGEVGIRRGDLVACYVEESLPSLYFALACAMRGVVHVPLSPVFSSEYFVSGIVRRLGVGHVFTTPEHRAALLGHGLRVLCFGERTQRDGELDTFGDDALISSERAHEALAADVRELTEDDVFMIQPTAGSTGTPKLVLRRHRAFTRYARFVGDEVRDESGAPDRFLMAAALTHAFGLHMLTTALRTLSTLAVPTQLDTRVDLDEVRRLDPTVLPLLPRVQKALYARALEQPTEPFFGPSARVVCSAGGVAPREILEAFQARGLRVVEFYGSSEASVVAVTSRQGWCPPFAGRIVPDAEVKIASDGELLVRSPGVTDGYVRDDEITRAAFVDGYYRTGDFAELSSDGRLRILGRKCDVFNTPEGTNIHPRRIEEMLERLTHVDQAMLVGDQRPFIAALIVLSPRRLLHAPPNALHEALEPTLHPELYREVCTSLASINAGLEPIERVARVALFAQAFPDDVYSVVGAGKVRRDRVALARKYASVIGRLYSGVGNFPVAASASPPSEPVRRRPRTQPLIAPVPKET